MIALAHRRKVRARICIESPTECFAGVGRIVTRFVPPARALVPALAGRATVFGATGALLLGSSMHGARAFAAVPLGGFAGWRIAFALADRVVRAREEEVAGELPPMLDRLTVCVLAGMSLERALRVVTPGTPGLLGEGLDAGLRALDAGIPRVRAYAIIAAHCRSDDVRALTATLARAERFGTSVSTALLAHARELRARQRAEAEAESRTAPVKMIFPLVFCSLPAFVLLTIAPIALSAIRTIGGIH